eukprot:GHVU01061904.1.p1 GENE.GHVU01061904.1~~GHVU01061904.1.p1  ORF type:complete len:326 (-),score=62.20 GHVU01061904.1:1629-2606(-)
MMSDKLGLDLRHFLMTAERGGDVSIANMIDLWLNSFEEVGLPHYENVKKQLLRKHRELPTDLRALIFVQQKSTAHTLAHHLNREREMADNDITCAPLHSITNSPPTCSISFTKSELKTNLDAFRSGWISVLVATVVAEEGLDVGEANCIIRFDPPLTGVSFVQGRGRARQDLSAHVVTAQRADRPVAYQQTIEELQREVVSGFIKRFDNHSEKSTDLKKQLEFRKQASLESTNLDLLQSMKPGDTVDTFDAVSALNLFAQKTNAIVDMLVDQAARVLTLTYTSTVRRVAASEKSEEPLSKPTQKVLKKRAATKLATKLLHCLLND